MVSMTVDRRPAIPAEWEPHVACWLSAAVREEDFRDRTAEARAQLDAVIREIARHEPVRLLVWEGEIAAVRSRLSDPALEIEFVPALVDDIWMRDIAPTVGVTGGARAAIDWHFSNWDGSARGARPGDRLAEREERLFGRRVRAPIKAEGGAPSSPAVFETKRASVSRPPPPTG